MFVMVVSMNKDGDILGCGGYGYDGRCGKLVQNGPIWALPEAKVMA